MLINPFVVSVDGMAIYTCIGNGMRVAPPILRHAPTGVDAAKECARRPRKLRPVFLELAVKRLNVMFTPGSIQAVQGSAAQ